MIRDRLIVTVVLALPLAACADDGAAPGDTDGASSSSTGDDPTEPTGVTLTTTNPSTTMGPSTTTTVDTSGTDTTADSSSTTDDTEDTSDTEDESSSSGEPVDPPQPVAVLATSNPAGLDPDRITRHPLALDATDVTLTVRGDASSIQSAALDDDGHGWVTYDVPGGLGGLMFVEDLASASTGPLGLGDRTIAGDATGLQTPKGLEVVEDLGIVLVADTTAGDVKAFALDASGEAAPMFVIDDLGSSAAVWDVHYDAFDDTLFAAGTNGQLQVYEDFAADQGASGPTRTITPTQNGEVISVNLHGIVVDGDTIFLTDVGDAMNNADGQLFVIDAASSADGEVEVRERVQGGSLGNPVDLELRNGEIYVAEKANNLLLVYATSLVSGDYEVTTTLDVPGIESVALDGVSGLVATSNPAGLDADAALVLVDTLVTDPVITATLASVGSISSIESVLLASDGRGIVTIDGPAVSGGGGVSVLDGLASANADGAVSLAALRLWGPAAGLVTPKGLDIAIDDGRIFVADTGAADIKVFDPDASGDVAPLFTIDEVGDSAVWDVEYDDANDRLYAAGVNGTVRVFDDISADMGVGGPDRVVTLVDGDGVPLGVNLHGIVLDGATDTLLLSDVGLAASNSDGRLMVLADASTASGETEVVSTIAGAATRLGNPVDIAFDGVNLYVAEKANSALLRYDAILERAGVLDVAEDIALELANPESVFIVYE
jgi:hypothetical protein